MGGSRGARKISRLYRLYGFNLASELEFPELPLTDGAAEVHLRLGPTPPALENPAARGYRFQARPGQILFRGGPSMSLLVSGGDELQLELTPGAALARVRVAVLSWGIGALLHLRGLLPLHGSAMQSGDHCVVFCAASGTGKSTLTLALAQAGCRFLDDNVAAVFSQAGQPWVQPGFPQIKLLPDMLERFGFQPAEATLLQTDAAKYAVLLPAYFQTQPLPLARIYLMARSNLPETHFRTLSGSQKLAALAANVFQSRFVPGLGLEAALYRQLLWLANSVEIVRLELPAVLPPPPALAETVLRHAQQEIR